jgi:hypothetical protein
MKIAVCSDLHLEFGDITLENPGVDVLILSGDIFVERDLGVYDPKHAELGFMTHRSERIHNFFYDCCNKFPHVVYVAGNHEHYHGDFATTLDEIKRKLKYLPNLIVLDKETWDLFGETRFIGGTLWTDMNKEDPLTLYQIKSMMNDFRCVQNSDRVVNFKDSDGKFQTRTAKFSPEDAVEDHKKMIDYLKVVLSTTPKDMKVVVVGHHAPSKLSTHPRYAHEQLMNGGYSSSLDEFIMDHPQIKLWTHGHTHELFDYMIGETRIVCNPRGYINYEDRADQFTLQVVEI